MLSTYRAQIERFDHAAMRAISRRRHPVLTAMLRTLTWTGHGYAWAIAVVTLALVIRYDAARFPRGESILHSTLAAGIAWILVKAIKALVRRRRPFQVLGDYARLTPAPNDDSFPSGHSASAFAFLTALTPLGPEVVVPVAIWAVVISYSRYYLGVHFPSDIVAGVLIGVLSGMGLIMLASA